MTIVLPYKQLTHTLLIDLYHVLTNANNEMDNGLDKASDESNLTTDTDKQWCILQ